MTFLIPDLLLTYHRHDGSSRERPSRIFKIIISTPACHKDLPSGYGNDNALKDVEEENAINSGLYGKVVAREGGMIYVW